mmetsp:Transcript_2244/g.2626  ORF Transcript_2244/g.2626 Transcript_2244/m.2626 type:complete len:194 (+) Transcript_2244:537-1118(+)|eukprot:CAMPEP_0205833458 /NCGR_PEP_ID=MMETSP0206-20130828/49787_1 /ASSEMBLY_ACC=CAM_ASM_000279 /TAXON_ID=36767 /ORGANISM="Euplotes focardii, Strain TN1" /LENGTH=193 /DNA_ID=CAMNT_0053139871 /DNA_START=533 /DNA_END=1114 /DNA_ORIENTATION=+
MKLNKRKRTTIKATDRIQSEKYVDRVEPYENDTSSKEPKANTPINKEVENSALTHFAYSLLEKLSKKGDGTSTKSNDNQVSGKTAGYANPPESQKNKSCKRKHRKTGHRKKKKKRTEDECSSKTGNISSIKKSGMRLPKDGSCELEEVLNTCKSIKATMVRRRSKTGDEIKGLALKARQFGNFIEEEANLQDA